MFTFRKAKDNFFYDKGGALRLAIDAAAAKGLSRWGAYVRTDARTSLRYRDRPSEPGQPPSAHKTMQRAKTSKKGVTRVQGVSPLREFLFFAYDAPAKSVVVGPVLLSGKLGNAPQTLEYGGQSTVRSTVWENHKPVVSARTVNIPARPFMRPAAARTNKRLGEIFAGSVTR